MKDSLRQRKFPAPRYREPGNLDRKALRGLLPSGREIAPQWRGGGIADRAPKDFAHRDRTAIELRILVVLRRNNRAVQRNSTVDALGDGPHDNVAREVCRRCALRRRAQCDEREPRAGAELELALLDSAQRAIAHNEHDELCLLEP